jgi:cytochrome c oxidase subunit 3
MNSPVSTVAPKDRVVGIKPATGPPNGNGHPGGSDANSGGVTPPAGIYRVGMLSILLAVSMTFAVLCSAYIYLVAKPHYWKPISLPRLVWVSTALIVASSYFLIRGTRALEHDRLRVGRKWLSVTLGLGVGFLLSQLAVWIQLTRLGLIEAGNQQRSFFLILSITHAVHVLGGLSGLIYLRIRAHRDRPAGKFSLPAAARVIGLFWHFMVVVWIFLLTLLLVWN